MEIASTPSSSIVGKLLEEISWEKARDYRAGGQGRENVLTAEVLVGLDFLPRTHFLGEVIRAAHGAEKARNQLAAEAEAWRCVFCQVISASVQVVARRNWWSSPTLSLRLRARTR